jgi:transposase
VTPYIEGLNRGQSLLLPECVDDYVDENNPVRVIDAFVDQLNLADLGLRGSARHRRDAQRTIQPRC